MRVFRFLGSILLAHVFVVLLGAAFAMDNLAPVKRSLWDVPIENCERRDICDLKRLLFVVEDYQVKAQENEYQHFTLMYATYETATFATLEKYAFVQFIRGAAFTSRKDPKTGKVEIRYDGVLANFNQWLIYRIPSWIIDSRDASPVYMSIEGFPRHEFYRWQNEILPPPWISHEENIYGWERPRTPRLYVDDDPQSAFIFNGVAYNISLEAKTCLYNSADIPQATKRDNVNFAEPLYCFPWRSSYVYNHELEKFESPSGVVFPGITGPNELQIFGDKMK